MRNFQDVEKVCLIGWKIMTVIKMFVWWLGFDDGFFTEFVNEFMNERYQKMCSMVKDDWKQNNEQGLKEGEMKSMIIFEDENFQSWMKMCFDVVGIMNNQIIFWYNKWRL